MRYFLDTEFNGFGGPLVSIALVPEDKAFPPFYEAVICSDPTEWVRDHILPLLGTTPLPRGEVSRRFAAYLSGDPAPHIVADWPEDIAHAAQLLTDGQAHRLIIQGVRFDLLAAQGFSSDLYSDVPHNAYHDAVGLRDWVQTLEASEPS